MTNQSICQPKADTLCEQPSEVPEECFGRAKLSPGEEKFDVATDGDTAPKSTKSLKLVAGDKAACVEKRINGESHLSGIKRNLDSYMFKYLQLTDECARQHTKEEATQMASQARDLLMKAADSSYRYILEYAKSSNKDELNVECSGVLQVDVESKPLKRIEPQ